MKNKLMWFVIIFLTCITTISLRSLYMINKKFKKNKEELFNAREDCAREMFDLAQISPETSIALYQLMKDVDMVMNKHGLEYWIEGGTLLGAVRHKGIIPYDDDLDIEINEKDIEKLPTVLHDLNKLGYHVYTDLKNIDVTKLSWIQVVNRDKCSNKEHGIDIFVVIFNDENSRFKNEAAQDFFGHKTFTKSEIYPLKKYQFGEIEVSGPNNPIPYLENYYSKDVMTKGCISGQHSNPSIKKYRCIKLEGAMFEPAKPTGPLLDHSNLLPN